MHIKRHNGSVIKEVEYAPVQNSLVFYWSHAWKNDVRDHQSVTYNPSRVDQEVCESLREAANDCELSWRLSQFSEPRPRGVDPLMHGIECEALSPQAVGELLSDDGSIVTFHVAFTEVCCPRNVCGRGVFDGWEQMYNGLTVKAIVLDKNGGPQNPEITYPHLEVEKHRIRLFWMCYFEQMSDGVAGAVERP